MVTSYALLVSLGIMSPGPGFIHTITQAINGTKLSTFKVVCGLATANLTISTIGVVGVAAFLIDPRATSAITLFGCAYLLFVAYKLLMTRAKPLYESTERASFISSFMIQASNIKAILFITSAVTITMNAALPSEAVVVIPIITYCISFIWYGAVGFTFQVPKVRRFLKPRIWLINKIASVVIIYLVIQLLMNTTLAF